YVSGAELVRLSALCAEREIALIADEVFFDYAIEPTAAAGAGRPVLSGDALTFSLGGLSKTVGLPQVKLGWIAVGGPSSLVNDALERLELICDSYLSVSTSVQIAAGHLLEHGALVRAQILERVRANFRAIQTRVGATPAIRLLPADGGWYAVLQVPTLESEEDLVLGLLTRDRVLTHPGYFFDFPRESFLVVSLLTPPAPFQDGIARVLRHFDCNPRT